MARSIFAHAGGSYDQGGQQDVADTNPFAGQITLLSGLLDNIPCHQSGNYMINSADVDVMTLGAPTVGTDDGLMISIYSNTAHAHTLTTASLFQTGQAKYSVMTWAAYVGAGMVLRAYGGFWQVLYGQSMTYSS